ncbi:protein CIA1-like isoform X3 [Cucurbita moschata]|uniref:Protein CIA1-like isoform X3 n=1 Tax=Cucurbita moschata TaxID=3662 RepID=A0A6J1F1L9_CUCMO|nr:protein CIA1-like isoform X3 [Cucurbita moschata]
MADSSSRRLRSLKDTLTGYGVWHGIPPPELEEFHLFSLPAAVIKPSVSGNKILPLVRGIARQFWKKRILELLGRALGHQTGHENEIKSVSWNASGSLLATCSRDRTVWIWEVFPGNEYECVSVLQGHTQDVKMVQWHPTMDLLFSCSYDNTVKVWAGDDDNDDWHCVQTLDESNNGHSSTVWALSFNPSGNKMVTCSDDLTLKIWESDETRLHSGGGYSPWRHTCTLSGYHDRTIFSIHWSRNGIISSGAADDSIRLFVENQEKVIDGPSFQLLFKKEKAHNMDVNSVQWSPGEERLLGSASDDGTIRIWELIPIS